MPDVGDRLRTFLLSQSAVTALVGDRVCQDHVPEETPIPFVAFQLTSTRKERCHDDAVGTEPFSYSFNVDAVSDNGINAKAVRDTVNNVLDSYSGTFADSTVQRIFLEDQSSDYESFTGAADSGLHVESVIAEVIP